MNTLVQIDSPYHEAFVHWVFESAIFLPSIYDEGKKVGLLNKKSYKLLFCKHLGFDDTKIDYTDNPRVYTVTLMDNPVPPEYPLLLSRFHTYFKSTITSDVDFVILPRQKKENYLPNDRPCSLTPFLDVFKNSDKTYRILNTDEINTLQTQIDIVNSGRNLIVTDGSPAIVNGFLCSNKTIYIVRLNKTALLESQANDYPMIKLLLNEIKKYNVVHFINGDQLASLANNRNVSNSGCLNNPSE